MHVGCYFNLTSLNILLANSVCPDFELFYDTKSLLRTRQYSLYAK
jgi:hypothetical protein